MKRGILAAAVAALAVQYGTTGVVDARQPTPPLQFFKNYFVTGDYAIGGVGVNGNGQGTINISGVPAESDVVAAFLYWQVVDKNNVGPLAGGLGVTFRGHQLENEDGAFSKLLVSGPPGTLPGTPACSSGGGGASGSGTTYTYRAEVLRYLDVAEPPPAGNGQTIANGPHEVTLPNGQGLDALGASLVLVFREWALDTPLSAVVFSDGAFTLSNASQVVSLDIGGFYDASTSAKLSLIVGGGQTNPAETLKYNGALIQTNPFASARAAQWDNPTFPLTADPNLQTVNVTVDQGPASSTWGCLTFAAAVYRTTVKDGDGDGLLDRWEDSTTPILDPYGRALPDLKGMGANKAVKDVFIETGYFDSDFNNDGTLDQLFYGDPANPANQKAEHTHQPPPESLKLMGDAFALKGIQVHFDMGAGYAAGVAAQYVIPTAYARGGDRMSESITVCAPTPDPVTGKFSVWDCQFRYHPGTVGWKTGFQFLRDQLMNPTTPPTPLPPDWVDPCELPGSTCERRFDAVRKHSFHYAMFTHATGIAKSWAACVDPSNGALHYDDDNGHCADGQNLNPDFFTPRTTSGVADYPGGDLQVSLGGFLDLSARPVGTPFMIASTLMHEFGHNAERRHGGDALEQNCKPTYLSVMNYLYQLRGLLNDAGTPHLDYSAGGGDIVSESLLPGLTNQLYRLGWYAPLATSYLAGQTAAKTYCNGAPYPTGPTGPVPMIRVDAPTAAGAIDWDANNNPDQLYHPQDVNFNGLLDDDLPGGPVPPFSSLTDSDDWSSLRLNQVAIRRNVGVHYRIPGTLEIAIGPSSTDLGKTEGGKTEGGKTEGGKTEGGKTEGGAGFSDLGKTEGGVVFGKTEGGSGDDGRGLFGGGDSFKNDPFNPSGEIDATFEVNLPPPYEFQACLIGDCTITGAPTTPFHRVWTTFKPVPNATSFTVYRAAAAGTTLTPPASTWELVASLPVVVGQQQYPTVDTTELVQGQRYLYFAVSVDAGGSSVHSNVIPIIGKNDPPVAQNDAYSTNANTTLVVPAATGVLANDVDPDSPAPTATKLTNPAHGAVTAFGSDGSFTYVPSAGYSGSDSFTYRATFGTTELTATVNITVNPVGPFTFVNVQNAGPPTNKTFKSGSAIPMQWRYASGTTVVDSGQLTFTVTVQAPPGPVMNPDPGTSSFRYDAASKTWSFNLQTKVGGVALPVPPASYTVVITPSSSAYATATFTVKLVKP